MTPTLLGLALLAVAGVATVIRVATRGRPGSQIYGLVSSVVLLGVLLVVFVMFVRSALAPVE